MASGTYEVTDQMGRSVVVPRFPKRIVSLVPSQTELLFHLGLTDEVVGITKFCVHPDAMFQTKKRVGGTKKVSKSVIEKLRPDLIIGNKEENQQEDIEYLAAKYPVWMSDITTLTDALRMIQEVGRLVGFADSAQKLAGEIAARFSRLPNLERRTAAYFIWRKPYMVAGNSTFINEMLALAGYENVFDDQERYPEVTLDDLATRNPEVILLASEPFPFQEKHFAPFREMLPQARIHVVDGELFSWYGSRLLAAPDYFQALAEYW